MRMRRTTGIEKDEIARLQLIMRHLEADLGEPRGGPRQR